MRNAATPTRNIWAGFVRTGRENTGLTPVEFAKSVGIDPTTVWRWESGRGRPKEPAVVHRVATVLGLDVTEALSAAGLILTDPPAEPTQHPPMDPDLQLLMRKLADPRTNEATRDYIRTTLRVLASLPIVPTAEVDRS
jgi:transcriptional regulator with XRE-family HTH domain